MANRGQQLFQFNEIHLRRSSSISLRRATSAIPITVLIGVRISWLIDNRNLVLAEFAVSIFSRLMRSLRFMYWKNTIFIRSGIANVNRGLISSDHWTSV